MRGSLHSFILVIALFGALQQLPAQARVQATLYPPVISSQETTELRFLIEQADRIEQFIPPSLSAFQVVSGPNTESGMEIINGQTRRYTSVFYRLQPRRSGDLMVGEARVRVKGQVLRSAPVKLKVLPGNSAASGANPPSMPLPESAGETAYNDYLLQPGEDLKKKIDRNLFVQVVADKTTCFVGEPVVATYKLYTRLKSESNIVKSPSFNGFSVVDLQPPQSGTNYSIERFNGRDYHVYLLRRVQLYPLQAGRVQLEPAAVENKLQFIRAEYLRQSAADLLSQWMPGALPAEALLEQQVTVQTQPVEINVKPLPEEGRPASFSGAVGQFSLSALVEKDSLVAGDAGNLKLLLTGAGNMPLIPAPDVNWPAEIEGFEPTVKDGYNQLTIPVSGSRIFTYSFSGMSAGRYTIPAVEFSYFDPVQARYQTVITQTIPVYLLPGTGKRKPVAVENNAHLITAWWWIFPALLFTALFILLLLKRKKTVVSAALPLRPEATPAIQKTQPPLYRTEALLLHDNPRLFYQTLHTELHHFLSERLRIPADIIGAKTVAEALQQEEASVADRLEWLQLLEEISARVYAPDHNEGSMQDDFARAMRMIQSLQKD